MNTLPLDTKVYKFILRQCFKVACVPPPHAHTHTCHTHGTSPTPSSCPTHVTLLTHTQHQSHPFLTRILSAHNHAGGHYKFALSQYVVNFNEIDASNDKYLLSLCIAIVLINMTCQARTSTAGKNSNITQVGYILCVGVGVGVGVWACACACVCVCVK